MKDHPPAWPFFGRPGPRLRGDQAEFGERLVGRDVLQPRVLLGGVLQDEVDGELIAGAGRPGRGGPPVQGPLVLLGLDQGPLEAHVRPGGLGAVLRLGRLKGVALPRKLGERVHHPVR